MSIWKRYLKEKKEINSPKTTSSSESAVPSVAADTSQSGRQLLLADLAAIDPSGGNLGSISCIKYYEDAICVDSERYLLSAIQTAGGHPHVWQQLKTRRLQCWGGLPPSSNSNDAVYVSGEKEPLPDWLEEMCSAVAGTGLFGLSEHSPNHVLINEYQPAEGIMHHTDGPVYVNRVVIISLGSSAVMTFRRRVSTAEIGAAREGDEGRHSDTSPNSSDSGVLSVVLRPRSVLFFSDEVYSHYMHGIEAVSGRLPPLRAQGQLHDVYTVYVYDLKNEHLEALPKREK
jgi:hypothetical protein